MTMGTVTDLATWRQGRLEQVDAEVVDDAKNISAARRAAIARHPATTAAKAARGAEGRDSGGLAAIGKRGSVRGATGVPEVTSIRGLSRTRRLVSARGLADAEGTADDETVGTASVPVEPHDYGDCYRVAIRMLSRSDKTEAELRVGLRRQGFGPDDVIEMVIQRVIEEGLCDDAAIVGRFIEKSVAGQGRGSQAITHALAARGIDRDVIAAVLADSEVDDVGAAEAVAVHYAAAHGGDLDESVLRRRLSGLMQRRGFPADAARQAIETALRS